MPISMISYTFEKLNVMQFYFSLVQTPIKKFLGFFSKLPPRTAFQLEPESVDLSSESESFKTVPFLLPFVNAKKAEGSSSLFVLARRLTEEKEKVNQLIRHLHLSRIIPASSSFILKNLMPLSLSLLIENAVHFSQGFVHSCNRK